MASSNSRRSSRRFPTEGDGWFNLYLTVRRAGNGLVVPVRTGSILEEGKSEWAKVKRSWVGSVGPDGRPTTVLALAPIAEDAPARGVYALGYRDDGGPGARLALLPVNARDFTELTGEEIRLPSTLAVRVPDRGRGRARAGGADAQTAGVLAGAWGALPPEERKRLQQRTEAREELLAQVEEKSATHTRLDVPALLELLGPRLFELSLQGAGPGSGVGVLTPTTAGSLACAGVAHAGGEGRRFDLTVRAGDLDTRVLLWYANAALQAIGRVQEVSIAEGQACPVASPFAAFAPRALDTRPAAVSLVVPRRAGRPAAVLFPEGMRGAAGLLPGELLQRLWEEGAGGRAEVARDLGAAMAEAREALRGNQTVLELLERYERLSLVRRLWFAVDRPHALVPARRFPPKETEQNARHVLYVSFRAFVRRFGLVNYGPGSPNTEQLLDRTLVLHAWAHRGVEGAEAEEAKRPPGVSKGGE